MGFIDKYPYTDFHELNLDWLLKRVKDIAIELERFEAVNTITYQGIWDITKNYPAWSIVTDPNTGNGYVSIEAVPSGMPISNTNYWVMIANYSQELANLGNRVINLEGRMTTAEGDIDRAEANITDLQGMNNNSTRKVICISDSYGVVPDENSSWIPNLKRVMGLQTGNFYRSAANGAGFIGVYPAVTFINQLTSLASSMSATEKSAIDDIIIAGGYNDAGKLNVDFTETQLREAISDCLEYINTNFPNARTYLVYLGWNVGASSIHSTIRRVKNIYAQSGVNAAKNVSVIDGVNWMHRIALTDATKYHPNGICSLAIALSIASVLNGGTDMCDLAPGSSGYIGVTVDADTSNVSDLSCTEFNQTYNNGTVFTQWQEIAFTNLADLPGTGEIKIGDITDGCTTGGIGYYDAHSIECSFRISGVCYPGTLLIYNGELHLGNKSGTLIPANSYIQIMYGAGSGDVMI